MKFVFKNISVVLNFVGSLLIILSLFLSIPLFLVIFFREYEQSYQTAYSFLVSAAVALALGLLFKKLFRKEIPNRIQSIFICSFGWIIVSAVGAIPFYIGLDSGFLDAYFETVSGFSTTGITMFTGLDLMPKSILFWRSLIQWIGGLGILTFFLAIVSQSGGTHSLYGAESHKIDMGRPVPGLMHTIKILWLIYTSFTVLIIFLLILAGNSVFDSLCHSFTALSTGGFSPYDASIAHYEMSGHSHYILIEYILIFGMLLGGTNFLIHYRLLRKDIRALYDNTEMKYWLTLIIFFVLLIFLERVVRSDLPTSFLLNEGDLWKGIERNFRTILFQVVSIMTTTGFGTQDIAGSFFGSVARQLFLVMMVIGGCVGSTSCGIKVLRIAILFKMIGREIKRLFYPSRSISDIILDRNKLPQEEVNRVSALFFSWIGLLVLGGLITAFFSGQNGFSSFSGMASALGNIGPCYISVEEMGNLHSVVKIVYILGMLAGRLEILPLLMLFTPGSWKT